MERKISKDTKTELTYEAIGELRKLLKDPDKKIRLRAISLILRHSEKAKKYYAGNDELDLDKIIESLKQ